MLNDQKIAGLLLTGGESRRMGRDKASIPIGDTTMARRLAQLLSHALDPVFEVGPGFTDLPTANEPEPFLGPLVAVASGVGALWAAGHRGPAVVLACDLPRIPLEAVEFLATWPGEKTVLPVVNGIDQPLCARWSLKDLELAVQASRQGERSLRDIPRRSHAMLLGPQHWGEFPSEVFEDVDTPSELRALRTSIFNRASRKDRVDNI